MKRKVVKMGLALVMSAALLAGCGGSSEAENFKNDLKAFAALEGVDNTDFEAMSKAVEELNLNTDEGKTIKDDLQEVVEYTKKPQLQGKPWTRRLLQNCRKTFRQ